MGCKDWLTESEEKVVGESITTSTLLALVVVGSALNKISVAEVLTHFG
jgi:hypothetical protein